MDRLLPSQTAAWQVQQRVCSFPRWRGKAGVGRIEGGRSEWEIGTKKTGARRRPFPHPHWTAKADQ